MPTKPSLSFGEFQIRDPIHGFISLSADEMRIVNSEVFQRLRRIRQLALANLVYPGATHTRFSHSLGVVHIAHQIAERLSASEKIEKGRIRLVRFAALLHDIGHGPFSHISEYLLSKNSDTGSPALKKTEEIHEAITHKLIVSSRDLRRILGATLCRTHLKIVSAG